MVLRRLVFLDDSSRSAYSEIIELIAAHRKLERLRQLNE